MSAVNDSEKERLKNDDEEAEQQQQQTMPPNEADPPTASSAAAKMDPEAEPLNAPAASAGDDSKVKFIGGNDNVDIEKGKKKDEEFSSPALTKAELMKYATDPVSILIEFWIYLHPIVLTITYTYSKNLQYIYLSTLVLGQIAMDFICSVLGGLVGDVGWCRR